MSLQPRGLDLAMFRQEQAATFDRRCTVQRSTGSGWATVVTPPVDGRPNCRVDTTVQQGMPGDSQDASTSSTFAWNITLAHDADVQVADLLTVEGSDAGPLVVGADRSYGAPSYRTATRVQCTRQGVATASQSIILIRRDTTGLATDQAAQRFQVVLSNYQPRELATETGAARYIEGTLIGAPGANVRVSDRFVLSEPVAGAGEITAVRDGADQVEATFRLRTES